MITRALGWLQRLDQVRSRECSPVINSSLPRHFRRFRNLEEVSSPQKMLNRGVAAHRIIRAGCSTRRQVSTLQQIQRTAPPHPDWRPPAKQPMPAELGSKFTQFDPKELKSCYNLLTSAILPRPIAFISTCGGPGLDNLAPYSYFNLMCHDPPTIAIGINRHSRGPQEKKDTWANIEATGEFTVNIISEWFVEAANQTSGLYPPAVSEWTESGLTSLPSVKVRPPRVAESAFQMECIMRHHYDVTNASGKVTCTIVVGECVLLHAVEGLVGDSSRPGVAPEIRLDRYHPIARLGGDLYSRVTSVFELPRPKV